MSMKNTMSAFVLATMTVFSGQALAEDPSTGAIPASPGTVAKETRTADHQQLAADQKKQAGDRSAVREAAKSGDKEATKAAAAEAKADRKSEAGDRQKLREDRQGERAEARDAAKERAADRKNKK